MGVRSRGLREILTASRRLVRAVLFSVCVCRLRPPPHGRQRGSIVPCLCASTVIVVRSPWTLETQNWAERCRLQRSLHGGTFPAHSSRSDPFGPASASDRRWPKCEEQPICQKYELQSSPTPMSYACRFGWYRSQCGMDGPYGWVCDRDSITPVPTKMDGALLLAFRSAG